MILGVTFQQALFVRMTFQQAIITDLTISRSFLQGWLSTGHDYRYSLLVCYGFKAELKAGHHFRAGLIKISDYRYGLSACFDSRADYNSILWL